MRAVSTPSQQGLEPSLVPTGSQVNHRDALSLIYLGWQVQPFEDPGGTESIPRRGGIISLNPSSHLCPSPLLPSPSCLLACLPYPQAPASTPRSAAKDGARMRQEPEARLALGMVIAGVAIEVVSNPCPPILAVLSYRRVSLQGLRWGSTKVHRPRRPPGRLREHSESQKSPRPISI